MNFRKTSEGGGVISDPKIFVAVFWVIFWGEKGGGHANPNQFCCKFSGLRKKRNIVFRKWGGGVRGRLEVFQKFIESGRDSLPSENSFAIFIGPRYTWGPIYGSKSKYMTLYSV